LLPKPQNPIDSLDKFNFLRKFQIFKLDYLESSLSQT